jgi:predicted aspartyl protease
MKTCKYLVSLRFNLVVLGSCFFLFTSNLCSSAQESVFELGIGEYQKQNYGRAIECFESSLSKDPMNSEAFYYAAITYEQLGNYKKSLEYYLTVIRRFPISKAAALSQTAVSREKFRKIARANGIVTGVDPALDTFPKDTWVDFIRQGNSLLVDGAINGHTTKMIFDTGASACVFSLDQLQSLGIELPKGNPGSFGAGVGSSKKIPMWNMIADLKLGKMERHNFPILVSSGPLPYPLLGENFYHDLEYTVDNQNKAILFKSRQDNQGKVAQDSQTARPASMTVSSSGNYVYNVPFKVDQQSLVVVAKIDGKECPMIFDTGADVCLFTGPQVQKLGLKLRWLGKTINLTGTGGVTKAPLCEIENAQVGPISGPMLCLVSNQTLMSKPLLGQTFFKNWHYTIDHASGVIKFVKK